MNDDELRARLRAADPARDLTDSWSFEIPEAAMSTSANPNPSPKKSSAGGRLALVAAAAAVVILAGVGIFAFNGDDEDPAPQASDNGETTTSVSYTLPSAAPAGRCRAPSADVLAGLDAAFEGTVSSVNNEQVVFTPAEFYKGDGVGQVLLENTTDTAISELGAPDFTKGKKYVVAVQDGQVQLCGLTTEVNPSIQKMYEKAFAK